MPDNEAVAQPSNEAAPAAIDPREILALIDDAITEVPEFKHESPLPLSHWDEDDQYPVEDWRREVVEDDTRLGYLEWVIHQRESNAVLENPPAP